MDDIIEARIKEAADKMRAKLAGSTLFGRKVDPDNIEHVLAAAFYIEDLAVVMGRLDGFDRRLR